MKLQKIPFRSAQAFSPLFNDYIERKPELAAFYGNTPDIEAFAAQIELRNQNPVNRELLTGAIRRQYGSLALVQTVEDNLVKLAGPDAFTVVTGHQLNIFTGPLYFIYKIVTAINTARALTARYPDRSFVPVYWMASEDHDVEEINHFRLFGKTYRWDTPQQGPVGRFDPSTLGEVLKDLPEAIPLFEKAYLGHKDLASATRFIANELFGHEGLLVIDGDDAGLKAEFREIMADDLLNHSAHRKAEAATEALSSLGYKPQIFPREINLFYLETGRRERIVRHDRGYSLAGSDGPVWTEQELLSELDRHPERFSPNVVLRPLYQEKILPNLAYIGGPAEVAYWLQLKPAFDHFGLPFPVLLPRNFALIVSGMLAAKLDRFGLQPSDLFGGLKAAKEKLLEAAGKEDVQLTGEMEELRRLFGSILQKAKSVDPSLAGFIGAEQARTEKILENIEKRLNKAEEQKQETGIRQLEGIANRLFPDGQLQERSDNFLNFYINDPAFIRALLDNFDPFDLRFNILTGDV